MSQGIFAGAVVMRGANWRWGDQDGEPQYISAVKVWEYRSTWVVYMNVCCSSCTYSCI